MITLDYLPTYHELNDIYGDPDTAPGEPDPEYLSEHCTRITLPFTMRCSWPPYKPVRHILIHRRIAVAVKDALEEIGDYKGPDYLLEKDYDLFGGTYNYRPTRGGSLLTTHAWCISIDLNPDLGPYRKRDKNGQWVNNQPEFITEAFLKRGFVTFPWDMMHFQAVLSSSKSAVYYQDVITKINENEAG